VSTNEITCLIVDDHEVVREGLRLSLSRAPHIRVIGEASDGADAISLVERRKPDVVVMDVAMPMLNGLEATRQILKNRPGTKVLVLTSYGDDDCVAQLMRAGASGYLIKQTAANDLLKAIREGNPTHLAVAFDEEAKAARAAIYSEYKATRTAPPGDLTPQFPLVRRVLEAMRVPAIGFPGYEADDVIATLTRRARAQGWEVVIVTGDKDLMQMVDGSVRSYDSMYEKWYGPKEVEEKWGVPPAQLADLLALIGDKIDNIPGVPGVGEKTAVKLLAQFGTVDRLYENLALVPGKLRETLAAHRKQALLSRELATVSRQVPIDFDLEAFRLREPDWPRLRALWMEMEFTRLLKELPAQTVEETLRTAGGDILRHVELFDLYQGEQIPAGKKSLAYALTFQAEDRSLTEEEVLQLYQRIQQHAAAALGAAPRRRPWFAHGRPSWPGGSSPEPRGISRTGSTVRRRSGASGSSIACRSRSTAMRPSPAGS